MSWVCTCDHLVHFYVVWNGLQINSSFYTEDNFWNEYSIAVAFYLASQPLGLAAS
ncbi:hypothetical protein DPMN_154445 [Dreissena polymorpha]|uniref:Uncharacterized protein n=1 Tax=Dreissena polymorpha TaxID=45954 RepID=A0A9D4FM05_DREPO|nr:hypothetical protein DPMN_154445 [Dreissena polymorpha]